MGLPLPLLNRRRRSGGFNPLVLSGVAAFYDPAQDYIFQEALGYTAGADTDPVGLWIDRLQNPDIGSMYRGLDLAPDYWIDATSGNDANAGTSEGAAWATLAQAASVVYGASKAGTVVLRVKSGTYDSVDDYFEITTASAVSNAGLIIVFEPGCVMDGTTAVASVNRNGFEFSTGSDWPVIIYGNGLTIQDYDNAFGSANGIGNRGSNILTAYDVTVNNCSDGFSSHGNATMTLYDCNAANCTKSAYAHVDNCTTFHYRCSFTSRSGASLGVGANLSTIRAYFEDCEFIPHASGAIVNLSKSDLVRCQLGTPSLMLGGSTNAAMIATDCFINMSRDTNQEMTFTRCYGKASFRQRNGGSLTMENCVISGPATGSTNVFFSNFNPGSGSPHLIRNNIFETASAAAFMSYDATNAGYVVAAGSEFFNNILSGSAAFDADLIAADTGNTVIVDNVTADALIGAANTLDPDDYGYAAGSPAIGAATDGGNSGFAVGDVAAMEAQQVRGPDGLPGYHATASGTARPTWEAGAIPSVNHDGVDDQLVATLPDLGTDATLAYVDDTGVTILTAQTISGATNLPTGTKQGPIIYIDRALTAAETTQLTNWLTQRQPT